LQQALGDPTVAARIFERLAAGVAEDRAPVELEFIALCVTAEVIVIVEDQYASIGMFLAIEMGGRQSTDASANHDQIVDIRLRIANPAPIRSPLPR